MSVFLDQLKNVPSYVKTSFTDHTIIAVICLVVFLFTLILTNKAASTCRGIVITILIAALVYSWVFKKYALCWTALLALLILTIIRFIMWAISTARQNRINRRIEERALAKAASRRGSWKNKKGYSGAARPIEREFNKDVMSKEEISDLLINETSELPIGKIAAAAAAVAAENEAAVVESAAEDVAEAKTADEETVTAEAVVDEVVDTADEAEASKDAAENVEEAAPETETAKDVNE